MKALLPHPVLAVSCYLESMEGVDLGASPIETLSSAGFRVPAHAEILAREERSVVMLGDERLAYVATTQTGVERLAIERDVLRLVAPSVSFRVPHVVHVDEHDRFDVRTRFLNVDSWVVFERVLVDDDFAERLGRTFGNMLAELHRVQPPDELAARLPSYMRWPMPSHQVLKHLPRVVDDLGFVERIREALEMFDARGATEEGVLVHGDFGFHNMAFDDSHQVLGVFDFDEAAIADRHWDFRNFVFHPRQPRFLQAACDQYEQACGVVLDRERIVLYNAASAFSHLAYRWGHTPEEHWCGRTLKEDLAWCSDRLVDLGV